MRDEPKVRMVIPDPDTGKESEPPFRLLVMGFFGTTNDVEFPPEPKSINRESFDPVMYACNIKVQVTNPVPSLACSFRFKTLDDFGPDGLLRQFGQVDAFLTPAQKSDLLNAIFNDPSFQEIEAAWRGLRFLVERTAFDENITIEFLDVSREQLLDDFGNRTIHGGWFSRLLMRPFESAEDGWPFSMIVSTMYFDHGDADIELLRHLGMAASHAHAPVLVGARPTVFGYEALSDMPDLLDEQEHEARHPAWAAFRKEICSLSVVMCVNRFLLRLPHQASENDAGFQEFTSQESGRPDPRKFLWGNPSLGLASCALRSFAAHRWFNAMVTIHFGAVPDLFHGWPLSVEEGETVARVSPTERGYDDECLHIDLAEAGFAPFTSGAPGKDYFVEAPTCRASSAGTDTPLDREDRTRDRLAQSLPYRLIVGRVVHCLRLLRRNGLERGVPKRRIETNLSNWLKQFEKKRPKDDADAAAHPFSEISCHFRSSVDMRECLTLHFIPHYRLYGLCAEFDESFELEPSR